MRLNVLASVVLAAGVVVPIAASAQGVPEASIAARVKVEGQQGPVGAIAGGTIRGVVGGVNGILGVDERPRFRHYVVDEHRPS